MELCKSRERDSFGAGFTFGVRRRRSALPPRRAPLLLPRRAHRQLGRGADPGDVRVRQAWIEAIDPARHGFRFDRDTTIGHGGTYCPFHFSRTGHNQTADG